MALPGVASEGVQATGNKTSKDEELKELSLSQFDQHRKLRCWGLGPKRFCCLCELQQRSWDAVRPKYNIIHVGPTVFFHEIPYILFARF